MSIYESSAIRHSQHERPLCDYSLDEIRSLSLRLPSMLGNIGCIVFPAKDDTRNVLVIFAGNLERFQMLSVARHARCKIIYFQDDQSYWYQGSELLPDLPAIMPFLHRQVYGLRPILFGQSSGGYASLVAAGFIENSVSIACAPQTASDQDVKDLICFGPTIQVNRTPSNLIDVRQHLAGRTGGKFISVFASATETANPIGSHMWCDWLHVARLVGIENVLVNIADTATHSIVLRRSAHFAELVADVLAASTAHGMKAACEKCLISIGNEKPEDIAI